MSVDNERLLRIRKALTEEDLDAFVCRLPENVLFLSGWWPLTGTSWVIFTVDGSCYLIVPACEAEEAQEDGVTDFATYEWAHLKAIDPIGQLKTTMTGTAKKFGIENGRIGLEDSIEEIAPPLNIGNPAVPTTASRRMLQEALPKANFIDATKIINNLRARKTPTEVERLRIANEIAAFGLAAFKENVVEGVTEIELAALANKAIAVKGSAYKGVKSSRGFAQISSAEGTVKGWRPCEITTNRKLKRGDIVLLELGVVTDGFWADNTRLAVVGKPDEKQKQIYELILKAQEEAIKKMKPGIKMSEIDKAARDTINDAGYGDYFIHITGHGVGWRYHEFPPLLAPDNGDVLESGMVSSVEPGVYIPEFGGMRIEDNVAVTAEGPDILSSYTRELN